MSDELFLKIISGEIPSKKVFENETVYAFEDINPQAPIHILIIPKKHIAKISEMEDEDTDLIGQLFLAAKTIAKQLKVEDYRLVVNNGKKVGQTVFHVHVHLLAGRDFTWPPG